MFTCLALTALLTQSAVRAPVYEEAGDTPVAARTYLAAVLAVKTAPCLSLVNICITGRDCTVHIRKTIIALPTVPFDITILAQAAVGTDIILQLTFIVADPAVDGICMIRIRSAALAEFAGVAEFILIVIKAFVALIAEILIRAALAMDMPLIGT